MFVFNTPIRPKGPANLIASRIPPGLSYGPVTELNVCNWRVGPWKHVFDNTKFVVSLQLWKF